MTRPSFITAFADRKIAAFLAAVFFLCAPVGHAASLEWKPVGDHEQIIITKDPNEGILGTIARIDKTGLLLTFSAMPQGLVLPKVPDAATIFKCSTQVGLSLGLETKTDEFGFVVSQKTDTRIVIDLFHDPLGARWTKPDRPPAATDIYPDKSIFPEKKQPNTGEPATAAPAVPQPPETAPAVVQPSETAPAVPQPSVHQPPEATPAVVQPPEVHPAEKGPEPAPPAPVAPVPTPAEPAKAPEQAPQGAKTPGVTGPATIRMPAQTPGGQTPGGQTPSVQTPPVQTSSGQMPPVQTPPVQAPSVQAPAAAPEVEQDPQPLAQPGDTSIPAPVISTEKLHAPAGDLPGETSPMGNSPVDTLYGSATPPPPVPLLELPPLPTPSLLETDLGNVLDTRYDTKDRKAPLPLPGPISAPVIPESGAYPGPPVVLPGTAPARPEPQSSLVPPGILYELHSFFGSSVAYAAEDVPRRQPARQRSSVAAPAAPAPGGVATQAPAAPIAPETTADASSSAIPGILPGVGIPAGEGGAYKGRVHLGGLETIPLPLSSAPEPPMAVQPTPPAPLVPQAPVSQPSAPPQPVATEETPAVAPAAQPVYQAPAPEAPAYQAPAPEAPVYQAPAPEAPAYQAPAAEAPAYQTPAPEAPVAQSPPPAAQQAGDDQVTIGPGGVTPPVPQGAGETVAPRIIYVNEAGEEIERPKEPSELLQEMRALVAAGSYTEALATADLIVASPRLEPGQREEALHAKAEMLFVLNKDNLVPNASIITDATNEAINFNLRSRRNAPALLRLGYLNLQLGNVPEAEARFAMLRRMFPNDENVPLSYYYWGDHHYNRNDMQQAADQFQLVLQKYPESRYAREAALGLARAFYRLGYYEQAFTIVEYIEQRWANFYLTYPPFLNMMGDVGFRLNRLDYALEHYWLYSNIMPRGEETDIILTRIADIYTMQQRPGAAREVYREVVERFPGRDGALVSQMRLAEQHINDVPTLGSMFDSFEASSQYSPEEVYQTIINEHPESGLVPLARLKLAMWHLWNHNYLETLDTATEFLLAHPGHELTPKIKDVALKSFAVMATESVTHDSYGRMREVWERYPILQEQEEILTPESRLALALSYWKDARPDDALVAVEPFFLGNKIPTYSEMALSLVLTIYLEYEQWPALEEVARRVQFWEISPEVQLQLDYALALSKENQDRPEAAAVLWRKLYDSKMLQDSQMVYATFFLARDAERRHRFDEAYVLGREALQRLRAEGVRNPGKEDIPKIIAQIGALMALTEEGGRLGEALEYADQYLSYLPEGDENRASVLFRMARIFKKQGNENAWRSTLTGLVEQFPNNVYSTTAASMLNSEQLERDARTYAPGGMF